MTVALTRMERESISAFLPVEALYPTRKRLNIVVFSDSVYDFNHPNELTKEDDIEDFRYRLSKHLDHPLNYTSHKIFGRPAYPRGIPWTSFPIVSTPWWTIPDIKAKLEDADRFALWESEAWKRATPRYFRRRYETAWAVRQLGFENAEFLFDSGETAIDLLCLDDMMAPAAGTMRLEYSYKVNFSAIAGKALRHLFEGKREFLSSQRRAELKCVLRLADTITWLSPFTSLQGTLDSVSSLYALQWLYALRKHGPLDLSSHMRRDGEQIAFERCFLDGIIERDTSEAYTWKGTGKHAPLNVEKSSCDNIAATLIAMGLIDLDLDHGSVSIDDRGLRFLDLLHPDCEDPDIGLRWVNPATGLIGAEHLGAVDDWTKRFFSKMKTRVNLL